MAISNWAIFWQPFENDIVKAYFLTIIRMEPTKWQTVRHLLSDRLYEANAFWQDLYTENNWYQSSENFSYRTGGTGKNRDGQIL